ncbi:MAG: prolyl oligopeptidase family serine peptidase [Planctomycetes bacterium]|nr:prolyl oligopeptidase family serine peptidase [Planctomycetota bacterium]
MTTKAEIQKRSEKIRSKHAGKDVLCCRWGWWGTPVLMFPTAGGDAEEVERMKMIVALRPLIDAGRIKVYSCDSLGGMELTRKGRTAATFAKAQNEFDAFLADEFVPWIRKDCDSEDIEVVTCGASIGAYNAMAAVCRHPDLFSKAIALSGTFDLTKWIEAPYSTEYYYTSPMHFVPNLPEGALLQKLRTRFILLATGSGPWEEPAQSWRLAQVLGAKNVPNRVDDWGKDYDHNWPTWREMAPKYLGEQS